MKFTVSQRELISALSIVSKATTMRSTMEILKGIHIEAKQDHLVMKSHDLSLSIRLTLPALVEEQGKVLVDSVLFSDIVRKLPDESITLETKEETLYLICARSRYRLTMMNEENFPMIPKVEDGIKLIMEQKEFSKMVRMTNFAVGNDETRPILTGSLVEVKNKVMKMVSVDGFTIAVKKAPVLEGEDCSVVIPGKSLNEVQKIIASGEDQIELLVSSNHVVFRFNEIEITSKVLEGNYINYERVIDIDFNTEVEIPIAPFYEALDRVSLLANKSKSYIVHFDFKEREMEMSSTSELGLAKESLEVINHANPMKISFNPNYILKVLRVMEDDHLVLSMGGSHKPCRIRQRDFDDYEYYVVPIRTGQ